MLTITIREIAEPRETKKGFSAELIFSEGGCYPIVVADPFGDKREQELEWYFERWLERPHLDEVKANRAKESVREYGESLFAQVFGDGQARGQYKQAKQNLSQLQIEIEGSSAFQALHWEALREPQAGPNGLKTRPLAVDCVMVRRQNQVASVRVNVSPVVNLLVVVARPDEENDVGYRTISRPLVEAVSSSSLRVNVDILRPGTYEALVKQLNEKGEGYYHIVHFDMHGCLASYEQLSQINETAQTQGVTYRLVDKGRYGRDDLESFEGVRAFLSFEGEAQGERDFVEASELAGLLKDKRIPVCLLNACQSAKQIGGGVETGEKGSAGEGREEGGAATGAEVDVEESLKEQIAVAETSLGSRLMAAGMQVVVAMGYSVTVSAAEILMQTLYARLFEEGDVAKAIRQGRYELYAKKMRRTYFKQEIALEDWLLPVVYANGEVDLNLRPFSPEEEEAHYEAAGKRYAFAAPTFGFVGRDLEILKIEKALLRRNVLLLRGMGGTGKTTLLNYLRYWWPETHFVEDVFYFGYDEKAHTLQQILQAIGKRVYGKFEFASFQAMSLGAQREKLAKVLKAKPYALVLDNLESVTGQNLAIMNTLPKAEQREIERFLQTLVGGQTKVVLGSRGDEVWLKDVIRDSRYQLRGLDRESRTVLAEKILEKAVGQGKNSAKRIAALREDKDFERLMRLLDGYPLAMEVVLANLARQSAGEIVEGLDAADVALDSGSANKTESILKCVEYSHSNLSATTQKLLLCLAPFKGFIYREPLHYYAEWLKEQEPLSDWKLELFDAAVEEAMQWGLLSPLEGYNGKLLKIQPVLPYFLRTRLDSADKTLREGIEIGFKEHCKDLSENYERMMYSQEAQQRELGLSLCHLEYENLFSALQLCLVRQESISIYSCLDRYLDISNNLTNRLQLCKMIKQAKSDYSEEKLEGFIGMQFVVAYLRLGNSYLQNQEYLLAQSAYEDALELEKKATINIDISFKQSSAAGILHQLGTVAWNLKDFEQAQSKFQQALDIFIGLRDRCNQAKSHHMLGIVAQELEDFEQAQSHYQQALTLKAEFNDHYSQASTYHGLGVVAQKLKDLEQAQSYYRQALNIYIKFNDRYKQAATRHMLGVVMQELREFRQAYSYLQQALDIYIEFNDRYSQAKSYHQLGIIAQKLEDSEQAQLYLRQALSLYIEFNDRYGQISTYNTLGSIAYELRNFEQAQSHIQQALDIHIEFKDDHGQSNAYHQLGLIEEARRNYQEASNHLLKALMFAVFNNGVGAESVLVSLKKIYRITRNDALLSAVGTLINATPEKVQVFFSATD